MASAGAWLPAGVEACSRPEPASWQQRCVRGAANPLLQEGGTSTGRADLTQHSCTQPTQERVVLGSQPDRTALCIFGPLQCSFLHLLNGTYVAVPEGHTGKHVYLMQRSLHPAAPTLQVWQPCPQSWSDGQQARATRCVFAACAPCPWPQPEWLCGCGPGCAASQPGMRLRAVTAGQPEGTPPEFAAAAAAAGPV